MEFWCSTRYESVSSVTHSLPLSDIYCVYNSSVVIIFPPYSRTFNRHFAHYLNRPFRNKINQKTSSHLFQTAYELIHSAFGTQALFVHRISSVQLHALQSILMMCSNLCVPGRVCVCCMPICVETSNAGAATGGRATDANAPAQHRDAAADGSNILGERASYARDRHIAWYD